MSPTRIARVERAFVARVIVATAVVGAFIGGGLALVSASMWDPFGVQNHRIADATAVGICISRDAFEERLDGLEQDTTVNGRRNLITVLENGIRGYDAALALIDRECATTPHGDPTVKEMQ